jgi:prepilin-type processing-associated H-X9-DG protein
MSVYFELSSSETGGPTWNRITQVRRSSQTVMFCEVNTAPGADHVMAHFWAMGAEPEVARSRHGRTQNYLFVDGHARSMTFEETYDPAAQIDLWKPASAP